MLALLMFAASFASAGPELPALVGAASYFEETETGVTPKASGKVTMKGSKIKQN